jgi:hypothetical protein
MSLARAFVEHLCREEVAAINVHVKERPFLPASMKEHVMCVLCNRTQSWAEELASEEVRSMLCGLS